VLGGVGAFAGLFRLDAARYRDPVLVSSTDSVSSPASQPNHSQGLRHRERLGRAAGAVEFGLWFGMLHIFQ
jgi:hypothetical protein